MDKLKVLLTGASGFLGPHIVNKLSKEGINIVAVVRPTSECEHLKSDRVKLIIGDLKDEKCIQEALEGVDVVIHAATSKGGAWRDYYNVNVKSTELLLKHCQDRPIKRFIFISSVIVYDHSFAKKGTTFKEDFPFETKQFTHYSKSKIEAEKLVQKYHDDYGIPTVVIRPAGLYGPGGLLYPARLGFSAGSRRYILIGSGNTPLPLSHVTSVADAVWFCIQKENSVGRAFNIVEDGPITQLEFLEVVKEILNPKLSIIRIPYSIAKIFEFFVGKSLALLGRKSPIRPLYLKFCSSSFYYSNERAKKELGWNPKTDVKATVQEMMQWHKAKITPKRSVLISKIEQPPKTEQVLQVGIVGCGMFSETHLSILHKLKHAKVVALCDPDEHARNSMASKFNVSKTYSEIQEMLSKENIDVVHILTPVQSHAEMSIEAMRHGCHVLVEKPMALNAAEARQMIQVAKEKNVKLCVDHNHLYDGVMTKARELVAGDVVGRIAHVEAWYGTSYSSNTDSRYLSFEARNHWVYQLPGSLYQNMISHPLSLLLDLMETVSGIKASAKYLRVVPHMKTDELRVLIENDRILGTLSLSLTVSPRYNFLNIYGTKGTLRVDFLNKYVFLDKVVPMAPKVISRNLMNLKQAKTLIVASLRNGINIVRGKYSLFEGNERLIQLFYNSILLNEPAPVTLEEGLQSMEVMDEIWKQIEVRTHYFSSSKEGSEVNKLVVAAS